MNMARLAIFSTVVALAASGAAKAADPLGFYIGGAVGQADVALDRSLSDTLNDVHMHDRGWELIAGVRPLQLLGAEVEYMNFGNPNYAASGFPPQSPPVNTIAATAHVTADAVFGLLYAPLPIPWLDVYGKLGAARTQLNLNGRILDLFCVAGTVSCGVIATHETETDLAYGAGVQVKFDAAALRVQYERINASFGNPYMFTIGATWTFR